MSRLKKYSESWKNYFINKSIYKKNLHLFSIKEKNIINKYLTKKNITIPCLFLTLLNNKRKIFGVNVQGYDLGVAIYCLYIAIVINDLNIKKKLEKIATKSFIKNIKSYKSCNSEDKIKLSNICEIIEIYHNFIDKNYNINDIFVLIGKMTILFSSFKIIEYNKIKKNIINLSKLFHLILKLDNINLDTIMDEYNEAQEIFVKLYENFNTHDLLSGTMKDILQYYKTIIEKRLDSI